VSGAQTTPARGRLIEYASQHSPSVGDLARIVADRPELESSATSLASVVAPGDRPPVDGLYSYWIDYANEYLDDPGLLARALLRTIDLVAGHDPCEGWSVDEGAVLDRAFWALAERERHVELVSDFAEELIREVVAMAERVVQLQRPGLDWVQLANSCAAIRPDCASRALLVLCGPTPAQCSAWLQYISVLAYPRADHPWWSSSCLLWSRFAQEFGLRLGAGPVAQVERCLTDANIEAGLAAIVDMTEPGPIRDEVARVAEEIGTFQIEQDLRRRRAILLRNLGAASPSPYWDDEYGAG
jgi:hypothetical protein